MKITKLTPNENLRWQSSRMMIPEHVNALLQHQKELQKKIKPELDEQQIEELERVIFDAINDQKKVYVTIFNPYKDQVLDGIIVSVNSNNGQIKLEHGDHCFKWINFNDIVDISF